MAREILVRVSATPDARRELFRKVKPEQFEIEVKEPAEGNQANERVCEIVAEYYRVRRKAVRIISGHRHVHKTLRVLQ